MNEYELCDWGDNHPLWLLLQPTKIPIQKSKLNKVNHDAVGGDHDQRPTDIFKLQNKFVVYVCTCVNTRNRYAENLHFLMSETQQVRRLVYYLRSSIQFKW